MASPYFTPPSPPPPPRPRSRSISIAIAAALAVVAIGGVVGGLFYAGVIDRARTDDDESGRRARNEDARRPRRPKPSSILPIGARDPARGPADALVTVVEFGDLEDPFTAATEKPLTAALAKYGKQVRLVWKDLPAGHHAKARRAAELAHLAQLDRGVARFWAMHDDALATRGALATLLPAWEKATTKELDARYGEAARAVVDDGEALGKRLHLLYPPALFVDGELVGRAGTRDLDAAIEAHAREAEKLLADGTPREALYATLVERHFLEPPPTTVGAQYDVDVSGAITWGSPEAPTTLVVFGDLDGRTWGELPSIVELARTPELRVVWRDHPTTPFGRAAAAVVRAIGARVGAAEQQAAIDRFFARRAAAGSKPLDLAAIEDVARTSGLASADVAKAIADPTLLAAIEDDLARADEVDVGTSSTVFFVDGRRVHGAAKRDVASAIEWGARIGKKLVEQGVAAKDVYARVAAGGAKHARRFATLAVPATAPAEGASAGPGVVTVQVFFDFECTFSRRALGAGGPLDLFLRAHPSDARVVFRQLPASYHKNAEPAAELALEAAAEKGTPAFFRVAAALFKVTRLDAAALDAIATAEGLDLAKVHLAMSTHKFAPVIVADAVAARAAPLFGTPVFVVGDEIVPGTSITSVALDAALGRAKRRARP